MAEGVGVEPTSPFGRRFSEPVAYHSPQPSLVSVKVYQISG